jgi:hypothetical protein
MAIHKGSGIERAIAALGGITQATIKTGIPYATLVSYRRRGRVAKYATLRKLSDASGVSIDELAGYQPPPQRKTA